ncbi:MAG: HD domain-containing phosphohydrolase [Bacteroidota bacterium]
MKIAPTLPEDLAIDLRQLVMTIAHAVDLVGVDDVLHGRRVGMLARELAIQLGCSDAEQVLLYDAGLLHDCGVSSTRIHRRLLVDLEWDGAEAHCISGYELLADFPPLAHLAGIIRYHHSRWDWLEQQALPGDLARFANLIYLADRIDVLAAPFHADQSILSHADEIRTRLANERDRLFSPELIAAFEALSEGEAFWLALQPDWVQQYQRGMETHGDLRQIRWPEFRQCAEIFARIIDAKSPYTEQHSRGVSRLSRHLAERLGFDPVSCEKIAVAGLLHDIGKLQIPDEIIEGPQALTPHEFDIMKSHSYGTLQVLKRLPAVEEIARWASFHHETPDGHGYPFHIGGTALPLEARIINVADVFQALAQDRPYRKSMAPADIMAILQERAELGRADPGVVAAIAADLPNCHRIALCQA